MANNRESISIFINNSHQLPEESLNKSNISSWNLEVTVYFKGAECNPDANFFRVPPCSGPYPGYEFYINQDNHGDLKKNFKGNAKTDINGTYRVLLEPNKYIVQTKSDKLSPASNKFTIKEGEVVTVRLTVDTGIR